VKVIKKRYWRPAISHSFDCREYWLLTVMKKARPWFTGALDRLCELAFRQSEIEL
jgi:hypothetical protein